MEKASEEAIFKVSGLLKGRLKEYFVSGNVLNLSHCKLSKAEI